MALQPALKDARTNQAFEDVMMPLRTARERAIAERKQYIVCFGIAAPAGAPTPMGAPFGQSIQMFRWDAGTALSRSDANHNSDPPIDLFFKLWPVCPTRQPRYRTDSAMAARAIDFDQGVAAAINNQVMFMPDGSAHDVNGNLNSGIIYVGRTGDLYSSRAVTLYGATGRIRGWRLINNGGAKWFQQ